jgi:hypothetical protein
MARVLILSRGRREHSAYVKGEMEKDLTDKVLDVERILLLSRRRGWSAALASAAARDARVL